MVVPRHHVLGAEVDEGHQVDAVDFLDIALVAFRDGMGKGIAAGSQEQHQQRDQGQGIVSGLVRLAEHAPIDEGNMKLSTV